MEAGAHRCARVFDGANGELLQEARSADASEVHGLAFFDDTRFSGSWPCPGTEEGVRPAR
jgi:hypothetical protein